MEARWAISLVVCLSVINLGSGLKCYNCVTKPPNPWAPEGQKTTDKCEVQPKECEFGEVCLKIAMTIKGMTATNYTCGTAFTCDFLHDGKLISCYKCSSELCNAANPIKTSFTVALTSAFVVLSLAVRAFI